MSDLKALVRSTLKRYGKDAATHFGVAEGTLKSYQKTGKFPLAFVEKVLSEAAGPAGIDTGPAVQQQIPEPEQFPDPLPMGAPTPNHQPRVVPPAPQVDRRLEEVTQYLQTTVDFYLKQFNSRIQLLERTVAA